MANHKHIWVGAGLLSGLLAGLSACGREPGRHVKTPAERLREQETIAYERELEQLNQSNDASSAPMDARDTFDSSGLELQLKQATLSAQTCPEVVTEEEEPLGEAFVTLAFLPDGSQESLSISSSFEGTRMGSCVLNAFKKIRVAPYAGEKQAVPWPVELSR